MLDNSLVDLLRSLALDSGSVTSSAEPNTITLVDSTKNWPSDKLKNCIVRIIAGKGVGQISLITGNGASYMQVSPQWLVGLDSTSIYIVYQPEVSSELINILDSVTSILTVGVGGGGGGGATADQVWEESLAGHPTAGTAGKVLSDLSVATQPPVPAPDAVTNTLSAEVVGNKADTAQTTVGTTRSIIAYVKGILNQTAGNALASVLGALADAASTTVDASTTAMSYIKGTLNQLAAIISSLGTFTRAFKTQWGTRYDSSSDLGTDVAAIIAGTISAGTNDFNATAKTSIQTAADAALTGDNLDHIAKVTDGANNYANTVTNGSILAKVMTKTAAGANATTFDNTTDSLEAIADAVAAIPTTAQRGTDNAALASVLGALNTAAATGVVTNTDEVMAYVKQLVTGIGDPARTLDLILGSRWDSSGDLGTDIAALIAAVGSNLVVTGTFTTGSATAPIDTGRTEADNYWNGCVLIPISGSVAYQPRIIDTFTNSTHTFTMRKAFTASTGTVAYVIIPRQSFALDYRDIWCADNAVVDVTVTATPADVTFPNVVLGAAGTATGVPLNATILSVNLMLVANILDTSAAINYTVDANDEIRVKISTGAWGTDDITAYKSIAGGWYTPASGMSSVVFVSSTDVSSVVTGVGTYNLMSPEASGTRNLAIVAHGASIVLKECRVGFRVYYKI